MTLRHFQAYSSFCCNGKKVQKETNKIENDISGDRSRFYRMNESILVIAHVGIWRTLREYPDHCFSNYNLKINSIQYYSPWKNLSKKKNTDFRTVLLRIILSGPSSPGGNYIHWVWDHWSKQFTFIRWKTSFSGNSTCQRLPICLKFTFPDPQIILISKSSLPHEGFFF